MKRCSKFFIRPTACFVAAVLVCTQATLTKADPSYSAQYINTFGGVTTGLVYKQGFNQGSTPQTIEGDFSLGNSDFSQTWNSFAGAGSGGLTASARATAHTINPNPSNPGLTSKTAGGFVLDDIVFSGPPGGTIPVTLLMQLNGTLAANVAGGDEQNPGPLGTAQATVSIDGSFFGPHSHFLGSFAGAYSLTNSAGNLSISQSGILSDYNLLTPPQISGPIFNVPTNVPVALSLTLTTTAFAGTVGDVEDLADAISDFSHTLSFPTSGPVFNLPPGYTANSLEGGIVNNQFVVPEPSTWAMLATGAGALLVFRRRKSMAERPKEIIETRIR